MKYFLMMLASLIVLGTTLVLMLVMSLPDVSQLERCFTTSMYKVNVCSTSPNYVEIRNISPYMLHAVIAAEDASFYSHKGFDWHEIRESFAANLTAGGFRRGGSTITQQLAKNAFLDKEKSLWRKVKEAYIANAIENKYSKNFILEKYLNMVEFGPNLFGIKAAAQHYFSKGPNGLHPLEAAYLAHLLPNPKVYSKGARKGELTTFNRKMVLTILKRMQSFGKLSGPAYQTSVASVDQFPWMALSLNAFSGMPSRDLEVQVPWPKDLDDFADDEVNESERVQTQPAAPERAQGVPDVELPEPIEEIEEDFR